MPRLMLYRRSTNGTGRFSPCHLRYSAYCMPRRQTRRTPARCDWTNEVSLYFVRRSIGSGATVGVTHNVSLRRMWRLGGGGVVSPQVLFYAFVALFVGVSGWVLSTMVKIPNDRSVHLSWETFRSITSEIVPALPQVLMSDSSTVPSHVGGWRNAHVDSRSTSRLRPRIARLMSHLCGLIFGISVSEPRSRPYSRPALIPPRDQIENITLY